MGYCRWGSVNSTLACAMDAAKLQIPVGHIEAGLRSWDRLMPEEINRIVVDAISDLLFAPSKQARENLRCEGIEDYRIHFVGNVMIDSLMLLSPKADEFPHPKHTRFIGSRIRFSHPPSRLKCRLSGYVGWHCIRVASPQMSNRMAFASENPQSPVPIWFFANA